MAGKEVRKKKNKKPTAKAGKNIKNVKKQRPAPSKKKKSGAKSKVASSKRPENRSAKRTENRSEKRPEKKSATIRSLERQKKLEDTQILGGFTSEIPRIGRSLDRPDRNIFRKLKIRKPDFSFFRESKKLFIILGSVLLAALIALVVVINIYTVDEVVIEGNVHYSNEEIYNMVIGDGFWGKNSIYLSLKYKNKDIEGIPFIQTMNVKITSPSSIRVIVYEKAMAGFIEYLGRYFYFDKDGTVIESTDVKTNGIPQIMGLDFDHIILYEKLPVDNEDIFIEILDITQLLNKYGIEVDKIYFDSDYNVTLYFGDARVKLGDFGNIDEKIIKLKAILPELADKKGVLRLDNYKGPDSDITFELDE